MSGLPNDVAIMTKIEERLAKEEWRARPMQGHEGCTWKHVGYMSRLMYLWHAFQSKEKDS